MLEKSYLGSGGSGRNTAIIRSNYLTPPAARFYDRSVQLYQHLAALNFNVMFSQRGHLTLAHNDASRTMRWRAEVNAIEGVDSGVINPAEVAWLANLRSGPVRSDDAGPDPAPRPGGRPGRDDHA